MSYVSELKGKTLLKVYVQPGASKNEFVGLYGEPPRVKIKIKAQPQDGEANAEVITYIAKLLGVSKSKVEILKGHTSRSKDLQIEATLDEVVKIIPE